MATLEIMRWAASISGMVAAVLVALNAGAKVTGVGFIIFSVSSVIWIVTSVLDGNNPLAIQNMVLLGINLFGIYRYLFRSSEKAPAHAK